MQKQDLNLDFPLLPTLLAPGALEPLQAEMLPEPRFAVGTTEQCPPGVRLCFPQLSANAPREH